MMNFNYNRIAIIGSGPSAYAAVKEIINFKKNKVFNVDIIDIGDNKKEFTNLPLKKYNGSSHPYNTINSDLIHHGMKSTVWPSKSLGGFSRLWGAAIDKSYSLEISIIELDPSQLQNEFYSKSAKSTIKKFNRSHDIDFRLISHYLAVDKNLCNKCGSCLTSCPNNAIWFSGDFFKKTKFVSYKSGIKVEKLQENESGEIDVFDENNNLIGKYQHIFLATGPISTSQILMKSRLIPDSVEFADSQTMFIPILRFPVFENIKSIGLSQIRFETVSKFGAPIIGQIYPDSRGLGTHFASQYPKFSLLIKIVWKVLSPFIFTAIVYFDSTESHKIILEKKEKKFYLSVATNSKFKLSFKHFSKKFRKKFLTAGYLPLFCLSKMAEAGEGYHFGANKQLLSLTNDGSLNSNPRIHVIDASVLQSIAPGPITTKIMKKSALITSRALGLNE